MGLKLSAYTSINKEKVPVLFSLAVSYGILKPGMKVLDYGCGRWPETVRDFLSGKGIVDLDQWDPNWFPDADYIPLEGYDAVCLSNVLNVIGDKRERFDVLDTAWKALKPGGVILVTVYEADGSGASGPSREGCWQERRKLNSYIDDELSAYMGAVYPGGKLWASLPKPAPGRKWYPPVGTKVTIVRATGSETPYTVVGTESGRLRIRECRLEFDGPRYFDTVADRITEGLPGDREKELVWKPKSESWGEKGAAYSYIRFGKWRHQPYTD